MNKYEALIELIRSAVTGEKSQKDFSDINYDSVYSLADRHSVSNLLYYAVKSNALNITKQQFERTEKKYLSERFIFVMQDNEVKALSKAFEQNAIPHVALKGSVLRYYYPLPDMRTCCDIDVYYRCDKDKLISVMQNMGYNFIQYGSETYYFSKNGISVEMHERYYETHSGCAEWDENVFDMLSLKDGCSYTYKMSDEDLYVHLITHMAKHFCGGICGLRSILDVFIFWQKFENKINKNDIDKRLKSMGLLSFESHIKSLSDVWFAEKPATQFDIKLSNVILKSATYGTVRNALITGLIDEDDLQQGKNTKVKHLLFPGYCFMKERNPILKKIPVLLPVFWVVRGANAVIKRKSALKHVNIYRGITEAERSQLKDIFSELDIKPKKHYI